MVENLKSAIICILLLWMVTMCTSAPVLNSVKPIPGASQGVGKLWCPTLTDIKEIQVGPDGERILSPILRDIDNPNYYILDCGRNYALSGSNFNKTLKSNVIILTPYNERRVVAVADVPPVDPVGGNRQIGSIHTSAIDTSHVTKDGLPQAETDLLERIPDQYGVIRLHPTAVNADDLSHCSMDFHFPGEGSFSSIHNATISVNNGFCTSNSLDFSYECNPVGSDGSSMNYSSGLRV